jgi:hypothetical protein
MAKTTSDKPSSFAEEALKRRKKQARREAKLMLEIEEANKNLKKAQKKQSKAQARLEEQSAYVHTLETRLEELRAPSLEPAIEMPPDSAELEHQQEPSELDSGVSPSDENKQALAETAASTSTEEKQHTTVEEEAPISEAIVVTNEVTEGSESAVVQDYETATEPAPTPTTPRKAPPQKTVASRKPTVAKRPTRESAATKRPDSRSQSIRQPNTEAE